ncbi:MAG: hypothetical protein J0G32_04475 [Alphaproteobacteria bacterium]|nr:hypothetical protein [Alphaproteobacteria bacterium]OJV14230.1 MAG: hypothetical protein BGO27_01875 [Alphaproteobacteria bacterium 33-17]
MKHIIRLITILLSIFSIFGLTTFVVTKKAINTASITASLSDKYKFSADTDTELSYLPFPKIRFNNAIIKTLENKTILESDNLEFSFSLVSVAKLVVSNQTSKNIDKVTIRGGYINIDEFLNFAATNTVASGLSVENALITNDFLGNINVKDDKGHLIKHGLGRVTFSLNNSFGRYKFNGYYVNNEALSFEGSLGDTFEFVVKGKGVEISKLAQDKNLSSIKVNITNFDLINDTVFESFPDYIKNNLFEESLKIDANYYADSGVTEFKTIDGSIVKGTGNLKKISNGLNISTVNLESINWGKKLDDLQNGFFKQALLNFNSSSTNGYAIFAKNIKIHGDSYDDFKLLLVKSSKGLNLQDLSLTGSSGSMTAKAGFDDQNLVAKGSLNVNLTSQSKLLKDLVSYLVSYRANVELSKDAALALDISYELNKEASIIAIKSLAIDGVGIAANLKLSTDKSESIINVNNMNLTKMGLAPNIYDALDSLFYTDANTPQSFLNSLSYVTGDNRIIFNFQNLTFNDKLIENLSVDVSYTKNQLIVNRFNVNDEQAKLSLSALLNNSKARPYLVIKSNVSYLDTEIFRHFGRDVSLDNMKLSNLGAFLWNTSTFDFPKWDKFDGTFDMIGDRIVYKKVPLESVKLSTEFVQSNMSIKQSKFNVFGGTFNFSGYFKNYNNALDLSFVLQNADFELTEDQDTKFFPNLSGAFTLSGKIKTNGYSIFNYINNMNGNVDIAADNIKILETDIDSVIFNIAKFKNNLTKDLVKIIGARAASTGFTDIKNLKGKFVINNGNVKSDNLTYTTQYTTGKGLINFDMPKLAFITPAAFTMQGIPFQNAPNSIIIMNVQGAGGRFKSALNIDSVIRNFAPN